MSNRRKIIIISRKSPLALRQAEIVKQYLQKNNPKIDFTVIGYTTEGDLTTRDLTKIRWKAVFVKDLQQALLDKVADIAVHSVKDLPVQSKAGLITAAFLPRDDPRDVLVSNEFSSLADLPYQATIGTSSPRRRCQLSSIQAGWKVKSIRGNIETRLAKLDQGHYDAIILAAAGLKRLHLENRITEYFDVLKFIPAIGQGVIGVECREEDSQIYELLNQLDDKKTRQCVIAEQAVNYQLGGDCFTPIAAHGILNDEGFSLSTMIGKPDGSLILYTTIKGNPKDARTIGFKAAQDLLKQGADSILSESKKC